MTYIEPSTPSHANSLQGIQPCYLAPGTPPILSMTEGPRNYHVPSPSHDGSSMFIKQSYDNISKVSLLPFCGLDGQKPDEPLQPICNTDPLFCHSWTQYSSLH